MEHFRDVGAGDARVAEDIAEPVDDGPRVVVDARGDFLGVKAPALVEEHEVRERAADVDADSEQCALASAGHPAPRARAPSRRRRAGRATIRNSFSPGGSAASFDRRRRRGCAASLARGICYHPGITPASSRRRRCSRRHGSSEAAHDVAQADRPDRALDEHHVRSRFPDGGAAGHHHPRPAPLDDQRGNRRRDLQPHELRDRGRRPLPRHGEGRRGRLRLHDRQLLQGPGMGSRDVRGHRARRRRSGGGDEPVGGRGAPRVRRPARLRGDAVSRVEQPASSARISRRRASRC